MNSLDELVKLLSKLPGIGGKSASRIAYHLLQSDANYNKLLGDKIAHIQEKIFTCSICGSFTESDPCPICTDPKRDQKQLCIVEQPQDVITITAAGAFNGLFHVLGGAINPLEGIGPNKLSFSSLLSRIDKGEFKEVIIATNPTEEGDTTALYIRHLLKDRDLELTRLASGLPIGGDLEYADRLTLARSLKGRIKY
jgi:recombination protein RecR